MNRTRRLALSDRSAPRTAPGCPRGDARSVARRDNDPARRAKGDAEHLSTASLSLPRPPSKA